MNGSLIFKFIKKTNTNSNYNSISIIHQKIKHQKIILFGENKKIQKSEIREYCTRAKYKGTNL